MRRSLKVHKVLLRKNAQHKTFRKQNFPNLKKGSYFYLDCFSVPELLNSKKTWKRMYKWPTSLHNGSQYKRLSIAPPNNKICGMTNSETSSFFLTSPFCQSSLVNRTTWKRFCSVDLRQFSSTTRNYCSCEFRSATSWKRFRCKWHDVDENIKRNSNRTPWISHNRRGTDQNERSTATKERDS